MKSVGLSRGFQLRPATGDFPDHWNTNDLKVAGHKSITIVYFFLSEIIFREKMVSLSNNDRFDNDKIFLRNIWHLSVITRTNYVSIFFIFMLKIHERTSFEIYEQYVIVIARCRVRYNMNVCRKHYEHFEWKRLRVAKNVLIGKECESRTLPRF